MKKILIVEDNSDYREIMNLSITKMGYRAIPAKNSYEAIAFAEAEAPEKRRRGMRSVRFADSTCGLPR
jgi:CheY-like chemotaxis protein